MRIIPPGQGRKIPETEPFGQIGSGQPETDGCPPEGANRRTAGLPTSRLVGMASWMAMSLAAALRKEGSIRSITPSLVRARRSRAQFPVDGSSRGRGPEPGSLPHLRLVSWPSTLTSRPGAPCHVAPMRKNTTMAATDRAHGAALLALGLESCPRQTLLEDTASLLDPEPTGSAHPSAKRDDARLEGRSLHDPSAGVDLGGHGEGLVRPRDADLHLGGERAGRVGARWGGHQYSMKDT
jgi:hypothetical protein